MSAKDLFRDPTPQEIRAFLDNLVFDLDAPPLDESVLPPADAPVKVVRSVRLPFDADQELTEAAAKRGLKPGELARDLIEAGLAQLRTDDAQVSVADVLMAIRRIGRSSAA